MLDQKPDRVSGAARSHVRCVTEKDGAIVLPPDEVVLLVGIVLLVLGERLFPFGDLQGDKTEVIKHKMRW